MGNTEISKETLTVASLNYSGVQESPFEFYEYENADQIKINALFAEACLETFPDFNDKKFQWIMGKVDKEWHTRFSPLYHKRCGVKEDNKMMSIEEFEKEWDNIADKQFAKCEKKVYGKLTQEQKAKVMPGEREQCRQFDVAVYKAILRFVYGQNGFKPHNLDAQPFINYQNKNFDRSFLDGELKQSTAVKSLKESNIDIFFIQEADINIIEEVSRKFRKQYHVVHKIFTYVSSAIFIKKDKFPEIQDFREENQRFMIQYFKRSHSNPEKQLNWNEDTVFQKVGKYILLSVHLTSNKNFNQGQINDLKMSVNNIKKYFPECEVLIGGDLNGKLEPGFLITPQEGKNIQVTVIPDSRKENTTNKKRTLMQAQRKKANTLSFEVKDYIVTTQKLLWYKIMTSQGVDVSKAQSLPLLPNSSHPYDHYLVIGKIAFNK